MRNKNIFLLLAVTLGLATGYYPSVVTDTTAFAISQIFINLLKLVSLPIIFLSIISTVTSMTNINEVKVLGKKVMTYTGLTTILAAILAFVVFIIVNPARTVIDSNQLQEVSHNSTNYIDFFIKLFPSNFLEPFVENQVIGVLFLAILLSFAILTLPEEKRKVLRGFFSSFYAALMVITSWIINLMPFAIWSFTTLFIKDLQKGLEIESVALYIACILIANIVQAGIVLPIILKLKGISPKLLFKNMFPALSVAFFSKSSSAALPAALQCMKQNSQISSKVAGFSMPLCTTINMNACAGFIFITVMFVSMSHGITFSLPEMMLWVLIATIGAIGNAGVPMGCYFVASAFLVAMDVPLHILGIILPIYSLIDMLETAINVWSDSCVTAIVGKEVQFASSNVKD